MMPLLFDAREVKWFLGFWSGKHRQAYVYVLYVYICMYHLLLAGVIALYLLMMGCAHRTSGG